jgi:hypothetical protein
MENSRCDCNSIFDDEYRFRRNFRRSVACNLYDAEISERVNVVVDSCLRNSKCRLNLWAGDWTIVTNVDIDTCEFGAIDELTNCSKFVEFCFDLLRSSILNNTCIRWHYCSFYVYKNFKLTSSLLSMVTQQHQKSNMMSDVAMCNRYVLLESGELKKMTEICKYPIRCCASDNHGLSGTSKPNVRSLFSRAVLRMRITNSVFPSEYATRSSCSLANVCFNCSYSARRVGCA